MTLKRFLHLMRHARLAHQASGLITSHLATAVAAAGLFMNRFHSMHPCLPLRRLDPLGLGLLVIVIATAAHLQEWAQQGKGRGLSFALR